MNKFELNRMPTNEEARKMYNVLKNNETISNASERLDISKENIVGMVELLIHFDYPISIIEDNGEYYVVKSRKITKKNSNNLPKIHIEDCTKTTLGIVSDTHLCNKTQQLHLLNTAYKYFRDKGIHTVLHIGDLVDGHFAKREEQMYERFMHGADEQSEYVIDMYPNVSGITTYFIQGSHDETHKKNGGATLGKMIAKDRKDMIYLGQDYADISINGVYQRMKHPGGGVSANRSRSPQNTIDNNMSTGRKPKILYEGHYHKSYYFIYNNVHTVLVPALCYQSQFMEKKDIKNIMGFYDVDIYSDENGNVEYFTPREHLFDEDDIRTDDYLKTKRLVIK